MIRNVFVCGLLFLTVNLFSQFSISGKVFDAETGEPLVGATVGIDYTNTGTTTLDDGSFQITISEPGDLSFRFVGYTTQIVEVTNSTILEIKLVPGEYVEEVIIQTVRAGEKAPISQTTLKRKEIQQVYKGEQPVFFLSNLTPSVQSTSESGTSFGNYGSMRLRGLDQKRINFTLNSVPLNDMIDHGVYFSNFTDVSNAFESIQIQRGVGASTNGVASYAGSVNFESINLETQLAGAELQLGYGSYNSSRANVQFNTGLLNDKWAFYGSFSKLKSDGYKDNTFTDSYSFFFSGGYFGKSNTFKLNAFDARSRNGLGYWAVDKSTIDTMPTYNPMNENDRDDFGQQFVQLQHIYRKSSLLDVVSSLYYNGAGGDFFEYWGDEQYNYPLTNKHYGFISNLNYKGINNTIINAGVHAYTFRRNNLTQLMPDLANPFYDESSTKDEFSAFVKLQYKLEKFSLFADVQFRYLTLEIEPDFESISGIESGDNIVEDWTFVNPKLGANYEVNRKLNLYASIAKASREPTKVDIMGWSLSDSAQYVNLVNGVSFKHEEVVDFEVGSRWLSQKLFIDFNLFYMQFKNGILPNGNTLQFGSKERQNIPESSRAGAEIMFDYKILSALSFSGNATYMKGVIKDLVLPGDSLSKDVSPLYTPEVILNAGLTYSYKGAFKIGLSGRYVSTSYLTFNNTSDVGLPAYFLLNARAEIFFLKKHSFVFEANNLLSERYFTDGEGWDYDENGVAETPAYFVNAPINFFGTLKLRF